jgi:hypothetical protein
VNPAVHFDGSGLNEGFSNLWAIRGVQRLKLSSVPAQAGINRREAMKSLKSTFTAPALHARYVALILCTALASVTAQGKSERSNEKQLSIAELKTIYLECDRGAMSGRLGSSEITACSMIYEELKQRAFGGDFEKFLAWSQAQNTNAAR